MADWEARPGGPGAAVGMAAGAAAALAVGMADGAAAALAAGMAVGVGTRPGWAAAASVAATAGGAEEVEMFGSLLARGVALAVFLAPSIGLAQSAAPLPPTAAPANPAPA